MRTTTVLLLVGLSACAVEAEPDLGDGDGDGKADDFGNYAGYTLRFDCRGEQYLTGYALPLLWDATYDDTVSTTIDEARREIVLAGRFLKINSSSGELMLSVDGRALDWWVSELMALLFVRPAGSSEPWRQVTYHGDGEVGSGRRLRRDLDVFVRLSWFRDRPFIDERSRWMTLRGLPYDPQPLGTTGYLEYLGDDVRPFRVPAGLSEIDQARWSSLEFGLFVVPVGTTEWLWSDSLGGTYRYQVQADEVGSGGLQALGPARTDGCWLNGRALALTPTPRSP